VKTGDNVLTMWKLKCYTRNVCHTVVN